GARLPSSLLDASDVTVVALGGGDDEADLVPSTSVASQVNVTGPLGAQLLLWEVATAVAGRLLGINPFDQPDVESAKTAARSLMEAGGTDTADPQAVDGAVQIRTEGGAWADGVTDLHGALQALLEQLDPDSGYLSGMVYLDRVAHAGLEPVAPTLTVRTGPPVTVRRGARPLHA